MKHCCAKLADANRGNHKIQLLYISTISMTTQDDSQTTKLIWPTETRVLIGQEKFDLLKSQTSVHTVTSLAIGRQNMSAI